MTGDGVIFWGWRVAMKCSYIRRASLQIHTHTHRATVTVTPFKNKPTSSRYWHRQGSSKTLARASLDPARGEEGGHAGVAISGWVVGFRDGLCHWSSDRTAASHPLPCPNSKA